MKQAATILSICFFLLSCSKNDPREAVNKNPTIMINYPETFRDTNLVEDYHGNSVADPYRWLEEDTAALVEAWVKSQNKVTNDYLEKIPFRKTIRDRYEELFNFPKLSSPTKAGEYYFFSKNEGLQNQSVIYFQKGLESEPEVFIDPNALSSDGTIAIGLAGFSRDYKYVAYSQSEAGSDWTNLKVMEVATRKKLDDDLNWVKFSGASWWNDGFFYSRYPEPAPGMVLSGNNQYHSIYYHKIGQPQSADKLVFENRQRPEMYHMGYVTEDNRYLIVEAQPGTDGFATWYKDLQKDGPFVELFPGESNKSSVVWSLGSKFLVRTDIDAPNYRLVEVDLANPAKENWKDIIPESEHFLRDVTTGGGYLFANYLVNATDRFYKMRYDGTDKVEIKLPGFGTATGLSGKEDQKELFYTYTSFVYPPTIFKFDVETGVSEQFFKTELQFNPADYEEKQVFYQSKDGTEVSMFLVHKKGLPLDGNNLTFLYGYGGFNVNMTPFFSASRIVLLENGGIFALPNLRGGGEYGESWHKAGMLENKQNVFDDFIAAGEYLIREKYTNPEKLAISGGSNGGLLVGACMTQRPDLFAVALPAVGVLDMLRYHLFTVGKGWIPEYGSSADPEMFPVLMNYSPLHNLKPGVKYPSTMVTTGDHDDRVVPAHSFKFAAELQRCHAGENPVIIRIETDAGHGAGKPVSKIIDEQADIWSFVFYNTNTAVKYLKG